MNRLLVKNIGMLASFEGVSAVHGEAMRNISVKRNTAVYCENGRICGIDTIENLRKHYDLQNASDLEVVDAEGNAVVPGFVDSHTHFIFGGYRPEEFVMRLSGAGYMEIMNMGGGIRNTVLKTREASEKELYQLGKKRLEKMVLQGVTSVEGKSGYGLDIDTELKQLRVMEKLDKDCPVDIVRTFLGAHAVADEYHNDANAYIEFIIEKVLPIVKEKGLAEFCDVFCEDGVFSIENSRRLLSFAAECGFRLKIHADEIESLGGAELAAELHAVSADHLLAASSAGIDALGKGETIATLLPCTAFCLGKPYANARKMIDAGSAVALASDLNPGSCFTNSIPLMIALGVIYMHMTIEEVLCAITINGAAAIGRAESTGTIEVGKKADLNILQFSDYRFLVYHTGMNIVGTVIKDGRIIVKDGRNVAD